MGFRVLSIAIFGVMGVFSRYFVGVWVSQILPPPFPYATFLINFLGSFLIGVVYVLGAERAILSDAIFAGLMVGFLGGFTTFSSFSLESLRLFQEGRYSPFALYFLGSPLFGAMGAALGIALTRKLL